MYADPNTVSACHSDREGLASLVRKYERPRCLEVGAFVGATAAAMVAGGAAKVYSVDTWIGYPGTDGRWLIGPEHGARAFAEYCAAAGQRLYAGIHPVTGLSLDWAAMWREPLDLVFLDAQHDYNSVAADIAAWTPRVRPGGILCGHDYHAVWPGVIRAVDESGPREIVGHTVWWRVVDGP